MAKQKSYTLEETLKVLAPIKAKLEEKYNNGNQWTKNAVKRDLDLVNSKIIALQNQNEMIKGSNESTTFDTGGYPDGFEGPIRKKVWDSTAFVPPSADIEDPSNTVPKLTEAERFEIGDLGQQKPYEPIVPGTLINNGIQKPEQKAPWYAGKDWGNYGAMASQLIPIGYNIAQGFSKPDKYKQHQNPFNTESTGLVRDSINRDITNRLAENQRQATGLGEIAKTASQGSGANYMAMMNQIAKNKTGVDFRLNEWKQNTEAQAKAQAAQQLLGIGQGITNEQTRTQMLDSQAKAAQQSYLQQGLSDLGKFGQVQQQMAGQKDRDSDLIDMMNKTYPALMGYYSKEEGARIAQSMTYDERKEMDRLQKDVDNGVPGAKDRIRSYAYQLKEKK